MGGNRQFLATLCLVATSVKVANAHTWMFSKGRAWMQASTSKPFREHITTAGQGTHAQLGPNQTMVVRWASSHNNTFSLAVVAGKDQEWFYNSGFYDMLDDYIDSAPADANMAAEKPRYHGATRSSSYIVDDQTYDTCAGGYCVPNLFSRELPTTDPEYFDHDYDMGTVGTKKWTHHMYQYNPDIVHNEDGDSWDLLPDRRVEYESADYPWLVAAYRYHNKVNMHSDWDLVKMDLPTRVFTDDYITEKGQHYIVHFSSRSREQSTYTDAIDVNIHKDPVDENLIYGVSSSSWGWTKTDHCQFTEPKEIVAPIRDATHNVSLCRADMDQAKFQSSTTTLYGLNVVPGLNPDVVPSEIQRNQESVDPICLAACSATTEEGVFTAGFCRLETANPDVSVCGAPAPIHDIVWANPAVSNVNYANLNANPGDYIAFQWDDVVHDVWLVPADAVDPCDLASHNGTSINVIPASHHATIDPSTEATVVEGRNQYQIPQDAANGDLLFICSIGGGGHCNAGQKLNVLVGATASTPDPELDIGVCLDGYVLCEDQSKQTKTIATVATNVNIPISDPIGAEALQVSGTTTRASTPWENWTYRNISAKRCRLRPQNTAFHTGYPARFGVDAGNVPVWEWPDNTLREVVEACSSSHPEACTGISWRGASIGGANHTIANPDNRVRAYSSAQRTASYLGGSPGWVPNGGSPHWMQIDMGEERKINGIVTQARGNNAPYGVTHYTVKYSFDETTWADVPGVLQGPSVEWLQNNWSNTAGSETFNTMFKDFFPEPVTARYVRIYPTAWHGQLVMRAEVMYALSSDPFVGKHTFRRCMETDQYIRVVNVGPLTEDESRSFTMPDEFAKSVSCPGCYQCREVVNNPSYGEGDARSNGGYSRYKNLRRAGFNWIVTNPGTTSAVLTINLLEAVEWFDFRLSWQHHNPEFICRIDPNSEPLEPDLIDDVDWMTFLPPAAPPGPDAAINAIAQGFQLPESVPDFYSTDQSNLDAVYPPGNSVNPDSDGPYYNKDWLNQTFAELEYQVPARTLDGGRNGYWPPKPVLKVSFAPVVVPGYYASRYYSHGYDSTSAQGLIDDSKDQGWFVDQGGSEAEHTNTVTGEVYTFGWRCKPVMAWYVNNWRENQWYESNTWGRYETLAPYVFGAARDLGTHFDDATLTPKDRCPDGRVNAWEATVPNGVYVVTAHYQSSGCTFENVRTGEGSGGEVTFVNSVEVADGKFTLSGGPPLKCNAVSWIKLDRVSSDVFPSTWLPRPKHEWWQMELDQNTTGVGMIQIREPHESFTTAHTYPSVYAYDYPDCRRWWLYAPAKCFRQFLTGQKLGVHPDLATYPNFPGFSQPFLNWLFDTHDTNGNGELIYEEFRAAQSDLAIHLTNWTMWSHRGAHNVKGTSGYHDDNVAHLWNKIDSYHSSHADPAATGLSNGDGVVNRDEFTHGILSMPLTKFCDYIENTWKTHGGNQYDETGSCQKNVDGPIPEHFGYFPDDGNHGFVVSISNIPCTDEGGCPTGDDVHVCETRLHRTSAVAAQVDCGGHAGKYIQLSLPGIHTRILPEITVVPHRSQIDLDLEQTTVEDAIASTNPAQTMVCYAMVPRPVPAADDADLLAGAKLHPKTIVTDNPEDPVFWSTCYDRVIVKEWLPLLSNGVVDSLATASNAFNNDTYCLDCECVTQNAQPYDLDTMLTPHWWLQPAGQCETCTTESPTTSPSTSPTQAPTQAPTISPTRSPTQSPTQSQTISPTTSPSASPSTSPTTHSPTISPTPSIEVPFGDVSSSQFEATRKPEISHILGGVFGGILVVGLILAFAFAFRKKPPSPTPITLLNGEEIDDTIEFLGNTHGDEATEALVQPTPVANLAQSTTAKKALVQPMLVANNQVNPLQLQRGSIGDPDPTRRPSPTYVTHGHTKVAWSDSASDATTSAVPYEDRTYMYAQARAVLVPKDSLYDENEFAQVENDVYEIISHSPRTGPHLTPTQGPTQTDV
eukprot:m.102462 g.102462  ORF g.102462 m.102462 type:complete len:1975 (-) comp27410_c1_seq4:129-6053(-)